MSEHGSQKSSSSGDSWEKLGAAPTLSSSDSDDRRLALLREGQHLRSMTMYEDQMANKLRSLNLVAGHQMQAKMDVGVNKPGDQEVALMTNTFGVVNTKMPFYRYEVTINAQKNQREKYLHNRPKDDTLIIFQRDDARAAFMSVVKDPANAAFFNFDEGQDDPLRTVAYDLMKTLVSTKQLNFAAVPANGKRSGEHMIINVPQDQAYKNRFERRFTNITFVVRESQVKLELSDLQKAGGDLENPLDGQSRTFLELATSQHALGTPEEHVMYEVNRSYLLNPSGMGWSDEALKEEIPDIGRDKFLSLGVQKTTRLIEGPGRKPGGAPAFYIECKKTPFYNAGEVLSFATSVLGMDDSTLIQHISRQKLDGGSVSRLSDALKGLFIYSRLDPHIEDIRKVIKVVPTIAGEHRFILNEREYNLLEYYQERLGYTIKYPFAPLAEVHFERGEPPKKSTKTALLYPLEVLRLCDNQRVHTQTPDLLQRIIKACAVPPARSFNNVEIARNAWGFEKSQVAQTSKIRITTKPMKVTGRLLGNPQIEYANANMVAPDRNRNDTWRSGRYYLMPVEIKVWGVYYLGDRPHGQENLMNQFVQEFIRVGLQKGMRIEPPKEKVGLLPNIVEMRKKFKSAADAGCEFMFFIHDDREKTAHGIMKLLERECDLPTQGVNSRTVNNILNKRQTLTLENVLNKTNIKMGGVNYTLRLPQTSSEDMLAKDMLYIGLSVSRPAGGLSSVSKAPDVLGYSANILARPFEFVGDFAYVSGGMESEFKTDTLLGIIKTCYERFQAVRRIRPRHVVIYRHGCDDGLFQSVVKFEIPLISKALKDVDENKGVTWTYIVPNKMHAARIYKGEVEDENRRYAMLQQKPTEQNIQPGTLIDTCLVHPHYAEFFLCSHAALQGTCKVPRYTILHNSNDSLKLDDLERITWHLSFGHQIVNMPVSLPAPSYIANRYAERGRMLYNQFGREASNAEGMQELTHELGYARTQYLRDLRVNA